MRPVIPRWTIHWAFDSGVGRAPSPAAFFFGCEPRDLFRPLAGEGARPITSRFQIEHDVLPHPPHASNALRLQGGNDLSGRTLQWLRFRS